MGSLSKSPEILDANLTVDLKGFEDTFNLILGDIFTILGEKPQSDLISWVNYVVEYNVPNGKKIRGKMVEAAYVTLSGETKGEKVEQAQKLGWCVEILQAAFLIVDDLMDSGTSRRGLPCWYRVNKMGNIVANDAFILENLVYKIIKKHFENSKIYVSILDLFREVTFNTTLGQSLDTRFSASKHFYFLDQSLLELYNSIAVLKTSYYTIYLPISLAMILAGVGSYYDNCRLWKDFRSIALKIGTFFQIQDDYFDCFADKVKMGKDGSDIREGKCSWLFVKAMELSDSQQKRTLLENYGKDTPENVFKVKKLYLELGLKKEFLKTEQKFAADILSSINALDHSLLKDVLGKHLHKFANENSKIQSIFFCSNKEIFSMLHYT